MAVTASNAVLGSHETHPTANKAEICANHDDCDARAARIKLTKGFTAKEPVKGHMSPTMIEKLDVVSLISHVNVVKGLKLYEDVFNGLEPEKPTDFVNEVRAAGHNRELSGDTFILFNKQMKGNKRELIQFGVPIFEHVQEESPNKNKMTKTKCNDRLYDLHLRLSVKPSLNKRVAITFFKVQLDYRQVSSPTGTRPTGAMTLWQPGSQSPNSIPNGKLTGYAALDMIPPWGVLHAPVVMLAAPVDPMTLSPKRFSKRGRFRKRGLVCSSRGLSPQGSPQSTSFRVHRKVGFSHCHQWANHASRIRPPDQAASLDEGDGERHSSF